MVTVYRVMDERGAGPYSTLNRIEWEDFDREGIPDKNHPTPYADGIDTFSPAYVCGFASMSQLQRWFSADELYRLARLGFQIYEITVPGEAILKGRHQIMFDRNEVTDFEQVDLEHSYYQAS